MRVRKTQLAELQGGFGRAGASCYHPRMALPLVKEELRRIADSLPDGATWEDVKYLMYARTEVEEGRRSAREEPVLTTEEAFEEFNKDQ